MSDRPELLLISLAALPALLILWRCYSNGRNDLRRLSGNWLRVEFENVYVVKFFFSSLFFILFIVLIAFSAAGFRWGSRSVPDERNGNEIVFVIDLSYSMLAEDIAPSRMKRSAILAKEVAQSSPDARVSVVGFKGRASLLLPTTEDYIAFDNLLSALHPDLITAPGTDLESGLTAGLDSFTDIFESHRIMVLFSDGEYLTGDPQKSVKRFADEKVNLIILGMGNENPARIPLNDGSVLTDPDGNVLTTELRIDVLEKLADATGGSLLMANEPGIRDELLKHVSGEEGGSRWGYNFEDIDRYRVFLVAALLCLTASVAVRYIKWGGSF